jgi:hypothetical protein
MRAYKTILASSLALSLAVPALAQVIVAAPDRLTQTFTETVKPEDAAPVQVPPELTGQDRMNQLLTEMYTLALRAYAFQVQAELNRSDAAAASAAAASAAGK